MAHSRLQTNILSRVCKSCRRHGLTQHHPDRISWSQYNKQRNYSSEALKLNYVLLPGRTLISLDGPDATDFLHNLIPAPILPLNEQSSCIPSAFLNAKGRILHDVFVHKPTEKDSQRWLLEVDTNSAPLIFKHLKKHKLRSKFALKQLSQDEASVFYLWPRSAEPPKLDGLTVHKDPRSKMGRRGYLMSSDAASQLKSSFEQLEVKEEYHWEDYMIHRLLNGHAEGPLEILSEHALPQESNFDYYGGIDFHKGCYLGQELTIRTHHTGVVRKRILPVQIYSDDKPIPRDQTRPQYDPLAALPHPVHEANISKSGAKGRSGRSTGKWLGGFGNIGLALCRLETMTDLSLTAGGSSLDAENDSFEVTWNDETGEQKVNVKAFVPPWLRQAMDDSAKARSERSQARRKRDSDEDDDLD